jgi:gamma-glutamylaminecyclotransferase
MCLIIHNPLCKDVPLDIIDNAFWKNPDGFGIFYHDTGEVRRTMCPDTAETWLNEGRPYTAHWRYATSGPVGKKQCHPFKIDGTYSLMMNGTIDRLVSTSMVDTVALCKILSGLSEEKMLDILRTHPCRFALLNRETGEAIVVNKDLWSARDGVLYSKANCFPPPPTPKKPLTKGGWGCNAGAYEDLTPSAQSDWDDDQWGMWASREAEYVEWEEEWEDEWEDEDGGSPSDLTTIAVYGTLKEGFGNAHHLRDSYFLGDGYTVEEYPMVVEGIPYVIDDAGSGNRIRVEVYRVDRDTLRGIDSLEGHPHWYRRTHALVQLDKGGTISAQIYMIPNNQRHTHMNDTGVYVSEYGK